MAQFARGFGPIHTRTKSANGFIGENYYADCNSLVRYPSQLFLTPLSSDRKILAYPTYRRFFFDGIFSGRFEFGFRLNEASIHEINECHHSKDYNVVSISRQILNREVDIHLLDGRIERSVFRNIMVLLRDGYIMSSTKQSSLATFDIASTGSTYVSIGPPFVFIRSSPCTKLSRVPQKRDLIKDSNFALFLTRSGARHQNFDIAVLPSERGLDEESARERMARLFYSQIRSVTFAHSFYLKQLEARKIGKSDSLEPAIMALIERIKSLPPVEGSTEDAHICNDLKRVLENSDIDVTALAKEIEGKLKQRWIGKIFARIFGYVDKQAEIVIEAAASAATKTVLSGGS